MVLKNAKCSFWQFPLCFFSWDFLEQQDFFDPDASLFELQQLSPPRAQAAEQYIDCDITASSKMVITLDM